MNDNGLGSHASWAMLIIAIALVSVTCTSCYKPSNHTILPKFSVVHSFADKNVMNDGRIPAGNLIRGSDGCFYGVTCAGGATGGGTIYKLDDNSRVAILHSFEDGSVANDGYDPFSGLAQGRGGYLYGTACSGRKPSYAIIFKMTLTGNITVLHEFGDADAAGNGELPVSELTPDIKGNLYGTTRTMGGGSPTPIVFKMSTTGRFDVLHTFSGQNMSDGEICCDGADPRSELVQGGDGRFYGTTEAGGAAGSGTVYAITPQGLVTVMHSFCDGRVKNDGNVPCAGLLLASDGNFYGTSTIGGSANLGTVFKMTPSGQVSILHSFHDHSVIDDGYDPMTDLIQGPDGALYGTTTEGGSAGALGTIFRCTLSGVVTILHSFVDTSVISRPVLRWLPWWTIRSGVDRHDGVGPNSALVSGGGGWYYGTTSYGGSDGEGVIYKIKIGR
jgi:uncharacterized repeat protein (TIGR03803 family)